MPRRQRTHSRLLYLQTSEQPVPRLLSASFSLMAPLAPLSSILGPPPVPGPHCPRLASSPSRHTTFPTSGTPRCPDHMPTHCRPRRSLSLSFAGPPSLFLPGLSSGPLQASRETLAGPPTAHRRPPSPAGGGAKVCEDLQHRPAIFRFRFGIWIFNAQRALKTNLSGGMAGHGWRRRANWGHEKGSQPVKSSVCSDSSSCSGLRFPVSLELHSHHCLKNDPQQLGRAPQCLGGTFPVPWGRGDYREMSIRGHAEITGPSPHLSLQ